MCLSDNSAFEVGYPEHIPNSVANFQTKELN